MLHLLLLTLLNLTNSPAYADIPSINRDLNSNLSNLPQDNSSKAGHFQRREASKDCAQDSPPAHIQNLAFPDRQLSRSLLRRRLPNKKAVRKHAPLGCQQFKWPNQTHSIALVGNGPLSKDQRRAVEVRFLLHHRHESHSG